jgi:hypothetical protein
MVLTEAANVLCDAWSTGFETTFAEAWKVVKQFSPLHPCAGRMGRAVNPPPQLGHTLSSISSTHVGSVTLEMLCELLAYQLLL